eukprot:gnl/TRDRNA2_/TRDRNA2_163157_c0_seq3.p1 gnl/TRDRNA2_/TRDRNA2_163157_c0~~gnl/TRDRNA2_/TRDRNA2_163157_c0_seq3.p1  ORF type:complete len:396 (-),score=69.23 gnl/TRDRNA2_/TRDRNA2_163157_c0_seq3:2-1189(-)
MVVSDAFAFHADYMSLLQGMFPALQHLPKTTSPRHTHLGFRGLKPFDQDALREKTLRTARATVGGAEKQGASTAQTVQRLGLRISSSRSSGVVSGATAEMIVAALRRGWRQIEVAIGEPDDAASKTALEVVSAALKRPGGVRRDEIIVQGTLQVGPGKPRPADVENIVKDAISILGISYLDLLVVRQGPGAQVAAADWKRLWTALAGLVERKEVRLLGVGNIAARQLTDVFKGTTAKVRPVLLQTRLGVYFPGRAEGIGLDSGCTLDLAVKNGLQLQGLGAEGGAAVWADPSSLDPAVDAHVRMVAQRHSRLPREVLLRWALQLGACLLVDIEDADAVAAAESSLSFALPSGDMRLLSAIAGLQTGGADTTGSNQACTEDVYGMQALLSEEVRRD